MVNELMVFEGLEVGDNRHTGVIYGVEYGDVLKIGYSQNIIKRYNQLKQTTNYSEKRIGNIEISKNHTNFRENEKILQQHFKDKRVGKTELFNITIDEFKSVLNTLDYKDESVEISKDNRNRVEFLKSIVFGMCNKDQFIKMEESDTMCKLENENDILTKYGNLMDKHIKLLKSYNRLLESDYYNTLNNLTDEYIDVNDDYQLKCYQELYENISNEMELGEGDLWNRIHNHLIELEKKVDTNAIK